MTGLADARGRFEPRRHDGYAKTFPRLEQTIGSERLAGLGALSCLVGMICPGAHSVFSGFDVDLQGDSGQPVSFVVTSIDQRFRMLTQRVVGAGLVAEVEAFVRVPPVAQPSSANLAGLVEPDEFRGDTVLVVGGSRGLGEVAAKLLAAGGADVTITYSVGAEDAATVELDIRHHGGRCRSVQFDVLRDDAASLIASRLSITHLHYYATPKIGGHKTAHSFDPATFEQYTGFYVAGFARVCVALAQSANGELGVLFPSSVAIAGAPREFCEYAMAKAAGEVLCCYLAQKHKLRIVTPRFPRLLTDQTATVVPTDTGSIEQLVLAGIRSLHRSRTPASSPASIR